MPDRLMRSMSPEAEYESHEAQRRREIDEQRTRHIYEASAKAPPRPTFSLSPPSGTRPIHHTRMGGMSLADAVGSIYGDDLRDTIANAIGPARHLALKHHRPGDLFPPLSYTEEDVRAKVPIVFQQGMPRSGPNQPQIPMIGSGSGKGDMIWPLGYADYDPTMPVYVGTRRPPHRPLTRPAADTTMHEIRHRALQQGPGRLTSWTQSATQNPYYAGAAGSGLAKMSAAAERAEQME